MTDRWIEPQPANGLVTGAVLALSIALVLVLGSSLLDIQRNNAALADATKQQAAAVAASHKSETQLNALARGVQALSDSGDANATMIVGALQRNGIHINATNPASQ